MRIYEHILVPLDGSELAETAIAHAETLARGCGAQSITLLAVAGRSNGHRKVVDASGETDEPAVPGSASWKERDASSYITRMAFRLSERGLPITYKLVIGDPAQAIIHHAEHSPCEIIVMTGRARSGPGRLTLGSVADKVIRASTVPVLIVGSRVTAHGE